MSILNKHIKIFNLIQIELENLGFTEFEHDPVFYSFYAKKNLGILTYLLSFHLSTKGIALSYVRGYVMVNSVNKILNQFIPDLSDNNELITLKNYNNGGELKDFEKINEHLKGKDTEGYIAAIMEHIKKVDFPFFTKYPDMETINEEILNKKPESEYNNYIYGKKNFKVLIIMKLCNNPNYQNFKLWAEETYKNAIKLDADRYGQDFDDLKSLIKYLDSGKYKEVLENKNEII